MWEDNRKKNLVKNIILALLIVVLVIGLAVAMMFVSRKTDEQDSQLSEMQVQQQQEQSVARQESLAEIQKEYEKDMQTVAEYLPGIVCWGDSITLGASGSASYPFVLQKYIDTYFCDIYDFRSSIENADEFSRLKWDDYKVSVPVVNMGAGPEDTSTVLGRCGVVPYVTSYDFTIPAGTEPVPVYFTSRDGRAVTPLTGGNAGVNNVTINGIEGVLSIDSNGYSPFGGASYSFARVEAGEESYVPAGTEIVTAATDEYRDYIHVVWIGTYGGYDYSPDVLVQQTKELLERQTKNTDRYIVLGIYSINGYTASSYQLDAIDTAMMQAFGNRYVNVRKYLCGDGMADAGFSKTQQDLQSISNNAVPPSFLTASTSIELNGTAQKLIGKLVFNRMESLGYFDEVYSELNITETTKLILKEDPSYFTNIIKNSIK